MADILVLRQAIANLPQDNALKTIETVVGWLQSVQLADNPNPGRLYEAASQLEDAVAERLSRLSHDYLYTARLSRAEESRLWLLNHNYWSLLAATYERCLPSQTSGSQLAETVKATLPALCTRLIAALGAVLKWTCFHHLRADDEIWRRLGQTLQIAEQAGVASRTVKRQHAAPSSPVREYAKAMIFHAASLDGLMPPETELAVRLIEYFLNNFVFTAEAHPDNVYWVDLQEAQPPQRLALMPEAPPSTLRFYQPGEAHTRIGELLGSLEQGGKIPAAINPDSQYDNRRVLPVLRHLVAYLAPVPPQRQHDRHRVKHRVTVLNGLVNTFVVFSEGFGGRPTGLPTTSWVVDNVSRGGFGALVEGKPPAWLRIGALLALQPAGGDNWLLGIVRRYHQESSDLARIGIETIARQTLSIELEARPAAIGTPALLLENHGQPGEVKVILPPHSFDLQETLECSINGQRYRFSPIALVEYTADYELARYQLSQL
ncbi:MAG: hypothetical protein LBV49_12865 [Azonexus sp.]|nr:hypothetical protein [Azonexus sp.]